MSPPVKKTKPPRYTPRVNKFEAPEPRGKHLEAPKKAAKPAKKGRGSKGKKAEGKAETAPTPVTPPPTA